MMSDSGADSSVVLESDIAPFDEVDEALAAANEDLFDEAFVAQHSKEFKKPRLLKFEPRAEAVGNIFSAGPISKSVIQSLMRDVCLLSEDRVSNRSNEKLQRQLFVLSKVHGAVQRETLRDKARKKASAQALKNQIDSSTPSLSNSAKIGIRTAVRMFLILIKSARKYDQDVVSEILLMMEEILQDCPPLSLSDGPEFSPDVANGIRPFLEFLGSLAKTSPDIVTRQKSASVLLGLALARGSCFELLSLVKTLLEFAVQNSELVLIPYNMLSYLMNFDHSCMRESITSNCSQVSDPRITFLESDSFVSNDKRCTFAADIRDSEPMKFPSRYYEALQVFCSDFESQSESGALSSSTIALIIVSQLDRLSEQCNRKNAEEILRDHSNRLAILYAPFAVELKSETFTVLSELIQLLSRSYISSEGCDDSLYTKTMYILIACLRILKVHFYQSVRAKLQQIELDLKKSTKQSLHQQLLQFLRCSSSSRPGISAEIINAVSSSIRFEAAQILAEAFEFFYPSISDQLSYLGELVTKNSLSQPDSSTSSKFSDSLSSPEKDLLDLLLSRFSLFSSGVTLVEELSKISNEGCIFERLLCDVLANLIESSYRDTLQVIENLTEAQCSQVVCVLDNFQRQILSSISNVYLKDSSSVVDVRNVSSFRVLFHYSLKLLSHGIDIIQCASRKIGLESSSDVVRRVGEEVLTESIVGRLLRGLVLFLCQPTLCDFLSIHLRLATLLKDFVVCSDLLYQQVKVISDLQSPYVIEKKKTIQSRLSAKGVDHEEIITFKNAISIHIKFDSKKCMSASDQSFLQLFLKADKKTPLTGKLFGPKGSPSWPTETITVHSDSFMLYSYVRESDELTYSMEVVGSVSVKPLVWLEELSIMSGFLCAQFASSLIKGSLFSESESSLQSEWLPLFRGGFEESHPSFPCLSNELISSFSIFSILRLSRNTESMAHLEFCKELLGMTGRGKLLIEKFLKCYSDRIFIQKSIAGNALRATSALFAVLLKQMGLVSDAIEFLDNSEPVPKDDLLRIWKKCQDCKLEFRVAHGQGEDTSVILNQILERCEFLLYICQDQSMISSSSSETTNSFSVHKMDSSSQIRVHFKERNPLSEARKAPMSRILRDTIKTLRRLKRLMQIRTKFVSESQDPESVYVRFCFKFLFTKNVDLREIYQGLMEQRSRAMRRLLGFEYFSKIAGLVKNPVILQDSIRLFASSFHKEDNITLKDLSGLAKYHHLFNLFAVDKSMLTQLSETFFQALDSLLQLRSTNQSRLYLIELCCFEYTCSDIVYLKKMDFVRFLRPFVTFHGTNAGLIKHDDLSLYLRNMGSSRHQPWNSLFSGWSLIRYLLYSASLEGITWLLELIVRLLLEQAFALWEMRQFELARLKTDLSKCFENQDEHGWSCSRCSFFNTISHHDCILCCLPRDESELQLKVENNLYEPEQKGLEFSPEFDFDNKGIIYYLATNGYSESWKNPAERGLVRVSASSLQSDSQPASAILGLSTVRCVTTSRPNQSFKIVFLEHFVRPTHYSLRHYSSWDTEALRSWRFEGSNDGIHWVCLREHTNDNSLDKKGATHTWEIIEDVGSFCQFRIFMTNVNSNDHWYLACSGFEVYGTLDSDTENPSREISDVSPGYDYFDNQDTVDIEYICDTDPSRPNCIVHTNISESWHTSKGVVAYSSGRHLLEFRVDFDGGGTNTWKFIIGVVPTRYQINSCSTWIGSQGGWGYIGGLGHKNFNSSTSIPYGEPYSTGDIIGMQIDLEKGTLEFFKNRKSMGIAFENLVGPVNMAVSMTGPKSRVSFLHQDLLDDIDSKKVVESRSWATRNGQRYLNECAIGWFKFSFDDLGIRGKTPSQTRQLSIDEIDCFLDQLLWVVLRCVKSLSVQKILCSEEWLQLLLSFAFTGSPMSRILSTRICRNLLPGISPLDNRLLSSYKKISESASFLEDLLDSSIVSWFIPLKLDGDDNWSNTNHMDSGRIFADKIPISNSLPWKSLQGSVDILDQVIQCISGFSSCVADISFCEGRWYYEVELLTNGLQQIGWATTEFNVSSLSDGVGDDYNSWAFDGFRNKKWHVDSEHYGKSRWQQNSIIGCAIDLEKKEMRFSLDGIDLGLAYSAFEINGGICPAISLAPGERCKIIFNESELRFRPSGYQAILSVKSGTASSLTTGTSTIDWEVVGSEFISLCRALMKSSLWKVHLSEILTNHVSQLPVILDEMEDTCKKCLQSNVVDFDILHPSISNSFRRKLRRVIASLDVLGGAIEILRIGARVRLIGSDHSNSEGIVIGMRSGSSKSSFCVVHLDSGEEKIITDLSKLYVTSNVEVPLSSIENPGLLIRQLAQFCTQDVPKHVSLFSTARLIFLRLQRLCFRVLLGLLQQPEFIPIFYSVGAFALIGKKSSFLTEVLTDGMTNTLSNLESRLSCFERRRRELVDPEIVRSNESSSLFYGLGEYSEKLGVPDEVHFDDFKHLMENFPDTEYRLTEICFSFSTIIFGMQVSYELYSPIKHEFLTPIYTISNGKLFHNSRTFTLRRDEYIEECRVFYNEDLMSLCGIVLKTNLDNNFSVGDTNLQKSMPTNIVAPKGRGISSFFGSCGQKGLSGIGIIHQEVFVRRNLKFKYSHDFDENGILYFLGTKMGTAPWKNPMSLGLVDVKVAKPKSDSQPVSSVVGREATRCLCHDMPNGWFVIDFKNLKVRPTTYTIRHYSSWDTEALRNWKFEGSNDGVDWVCLREHVNDTSIEKRAQSASWNLSVSEFYSQFRIYMTGLNSNDHYFLCLSGFEVYGDLVLSSSLKPSLERSESWHSQSITGTESRLMEIPKQKVENSGNIFSLGHGGSGRLGLNSLSDCSIPTLINSLNEKRIVEVAAFNQHVLALTEDGKVYSWGNGADGRLGHGSVSGINSPKLISALKNEVIVQVRTGNSFSAVLDSMGNVWVFGKNNEGQLGIGNTSEQRTPIKITGVLEQIDIARLGAGAFHVLAVATSGDLYSWGRNLRGQLGINSTIKKKLSPVKVSSAPVFVSVCGGWDHSLGLTANGEVFCWGNGYEGTRPATGLGVLQNVLAPTLNTHLSDKDIVRISCGWDHSMALSRTGQVFIWGSNSNGVLGDGSTTQHSTPEILTELSNEKVISIDGGQNHTFCVTSRGEIWGWGMICGDELVKPKKFDSSVIFRSVVCGDKSTYFLSCDAPPMVESPVAFADRFESVFPPYPRYAFLLGTVPGLCKAELELRSTQLEVHLISIERSTQSPAEQGPEPLAQEITETNNTLNGNSTLIYASNDPRDLLCVESLEFIGSDSMHFESSLISALVFVFDDLKYVRSTQLFDDFDKGKWMAFCENKSHKQDLHLYEPISFFDFPYMPSNKKIKIDNPRFGRYFVIKLLSSPNFSRCGHVPNLFHFFGTRKNIYYHEYQLGNYFSDLNLDNSSLYPIKPLTEFCRGSEIAHLYGSSEAIESEASLKIGLENRFIFLKAQSEPLMKPNGLSLLFKFRRFSDELLHESSYLFRFVDTDGQDLLHARVSSDVTTLCISTLEDKILDQKHCKHDVKLAFSFAKEWVTAFIVLEYDNVNCIIYLYFDGKPYYKLSFSSSSLISRLTSGKMTIRFMEHFPCLFKCLVYWPYALALDVHSTVVDSSYDFIIQDYLEESEHFSSNKLYEFSRGHMPSDSTLGFSCHENILLRRVSLSETDLHVMDFPCNESSCLELQKSSILLSNPLGSSITSKGKVTLILDIYVLTDPLIQFNLLGFASPNTENQVIQVVSISENGYVNIFGKSNRRLSPISRMKWHRIVISIDLVRCFISAYVDGHLACSFDEKSSFLAISSAYLNRIVLFYPHDYFFEKAPKLRILRAQIRSLCLSQSQAIKLGSPSMPLDIGRDIESISSSLRHMGIPSGWCKKALVQTSMNRSKAYEWILQNVSNLTAEDQLEEHRKIASTMSLMGFPLSCCEDSLALCKNDLRQAIEWILYNHFDIHEASMIEPKTLHSKRNLTLEKGHFKNATFRILKSTRENIESCPKILLQKAPPKRFIEFPEIFEISKKELICSEALTENFLQISYSRSCLVSVLKNWPDDITPSLEELGGLEFFLKFLRLIHVSYPHGGFEVLHGFFIRILDMEETTIRSLNRGEKMSLVHFKSYTPLSQRLFIDALHQMACLIEDPERRIDSESDALIYASPSVITWILNLFVCLLSNGDRPNLTRTLRNSRPFLIAELFFSQPMMNFLFEIIIVLHGEERLAFVRLVAQLIKLGVSFDHSRTVILLELMNQIHMSQSPGGVYSSGFQALVELNVCIHRLMKESQFQAESTGNNMTQTEFAKRISLVSCEAHLHNELIETENRGVQFIYSDDFDTNGILYYLGTRKNTCPWENPAELGFVKVSSSSLMNDSSPVSAIVGREVVRCVSQPVPNQWFLVDLLEHSVIPTHYTLRHYLSWDTEALRNWKFEASNDGITWVTLREHINDGALNRKGESHTWELYDVDESYSKFRIFMTGLNSNQHWYMALSGFEIYGIFDADVVTWTDADVDISREDGQDEQGIIYFLATKGNTEAWINPDVNGVVSVSVSSLQQDSEPKSAIVGRSAVRCVTQPTPNQWFVVDLQDNRALPTKYSLRHYSSYDSEALRSWNLEASNDGLNWTSLIAHKNDASLTQKGQWYSWDISGINELYSKFRVIMTDKNSNDHWFLAISGFEIYGKLRYRTPAPLKKSVSITKTKPWFDNIVLVSKIIESIDLKLDIPIDFAFKLLKLIRQWPDQDNVSFSDYPLESFLMINRRFTRALDLQLVNLINRIADKNDLNPRSMKANEFSPSSEDLVHYDKIENLPINALQIRFLFLQQLNMKISSVLPYVDFSLPRDLSTLTDRINSIRSYLFWKTKEALWNTALDATCCPVSDIELELDRFKAQSLIGSNKTDYKGKRTLFGQAFQQLNHRDPKIFRLEKNKCAWKTVFKGEFSDDYGGPYRNSIADMCSELESQALPLFIKCPNGRENIGINREKFVPCPSSSSPICIRMYEFLGKLMGLAIRTKNPMSLNFPSIVWKYLVGEKIMEEDVLLIDLLSFKILDELRNFEADESLSEELFEEIVNAKFIVVGSDQKIYPLIPGGEELAVTWENRKEFIKASVDYRLNEFNTQCAAIKHGLACTIPYPLLSLFTWQDLELQVCGKPSLNVDLLERMTIYDGCSRSDDHIEFFWRMMRERLDDDEKSQFLKFVWGRSRLPVRAEDFERKFKISRLHRYDQDPDAYLPVSHTCFFSLDLPCYSSMEIMHQKVLYAITHCVAIDADDTSNAQDAARRQTVSSEMDDQDDE